MPGARTIPTSFGRATAVLGEHANLNTLLDRLRDLCTASGEQLTPGVDGHRLLVVLRDRLSVHFAGEEEDGYFGTLVSMQPALRATVTRLEGEHREFVAMVDSLITLAQASNQPSEFATVMDAFLVRFQAHERAENALLQEFLLRDEGDPGQ